ncbi:MAG: PEP-CTERM sorting domain-containing protein [Verrucomicrobiota bacterium]
MPHNFGVELAIYSNVPGVGTNGFSQPGNSLWSSVFNWGQFSTRPYATNSQGWYEPRTGSWLTNTHSIMWELNITNIQNLNQQQGVTYWLAVEFTGTNTDTIGWKTALTSTNDAAVWLTPSWVWTKLVDQSTNSMDLAFVITTIPEPSTSLLVALGGLALIGLRRQVARH